MITGFVGALFLVVTVLNFKLVDFKAGDTTQTAILISTIVLVVSTFIFCYLYRPLGYVVDGNKLIIRRPIKDIMIDFNTIKDAFLPTKESMKWTIRTFGNGGIFGYFGRFRNGTYGGMTWYATRTSNYLIIVTEDNSKIVLTPDDPGMIREFKK